MRQVLLSGSLGTIGELLFASLGMSCTFKNIQISHVLESWWSQLERTHGKKLSFADPRKRLPWLRLSESKLWVLTHLYASSNFLGCLSMRRKQVNKTERKRTWLIAISFFVPDVVPDFVPDMFPCVYYLWPFTYFRCLPVWGAFVALGSLLTRDGLLSWSPLWT